MTTKEQFQKNMKANADRLRKDGRDELADFTEKFFHPTSEWLATTIENIQASSTPHDRQLADMLQLYIEGAATILGSTIVGIAKPGQEESLALKLMHVMTISTITTIKNVKRREAERKINTV